MNKTAEEIKARYKAYQDFEEGHGVSYTLWLEQTILDLSTPSKLAEMPTDEEMKNVLQERFTNIGRLSEFPDGERRQREIDHEYWMIVSYIRSLFSRPSIEMPTEPTDEKILQAFKSLTLYSSSDDEKCFVMRSLFSRQEQEIRDIVAKKHGYQSWLDLVDLIGKNEHLKKYEDEVRSFRPEDIEQKPDGWVVNGKFIETEEEMNFVCAVHHWTAKPVYFSSISKDREGFDTTELKKEIEGKSYVESKRFEDDEDVVVVEISRILKTIDKHFPPDSGKDKKGEDNA